MTLEDLVNGKVVKHIHMVSFVVDSHRLECVYSDGLLTTAVVTSLSDGSHKYLTLEEKEAIIDLVRERIGEAPIVSY